MLDHNVGGEDVMGIKRGSKRSGIITQHGDLGNGIQWEQIQPHIIPNGLDDWMQRFRFHSDIAWRFVFTLDSTLVLVSQKICCLSVLSHSIGKLSTIITGLTRQTDIWPVMSDLYHYYTIRTVVTGQYSNVTGIPFLHYVWLAIGHIPPISQVFKFVCCDSYWLEYIISLL